MKKRRRRRRRKRRRRRLQFRDREIENRRDQDIKPLIYFIRRVG